MTYCLAWNALLRADAFPAVHVLAQAGWKQRYVLHGQAVEERCNEVIRAAKAVQAVGSAARRGPSTATLAAAAWQAASAG